MIEEWQPNTRINLSADYIIGDLTIGGALRYFGSYTVQEGSGGRSCSTKLTAENGSPTSRAIIS